VQKGDEKMIKIAPSILSANFGNLNEDIKKVEEAGADYLHIDVMDGHFVPNISFGIPVIKSIRGSSNMIFDVHLMIENPDLYIQQFKDAGADIITVHAEASRHILRTVQEIKKLGVRAGVALNPGTPEEAIKYVLPDVDMVLVMSVNPGFGGQKFIKSSIDKISRIKNMAGMMDCRTDIEVDGGINLSNVKEVVDAGANVIVAGSSIYKSSSIQNTIREFKRIGETK
jgi:ribulose-phosphate 3-epimerase